MSRREEGANVDLKPTHAGSRRLILDVEVAYARVGRWRAEVANVHVHIAVRKRPAVRLALEQAALLPSPTSTSAPAPSKLRRVLPRESVQRPLAM